MLDNYCVGIGPLNSASQANAWSASLRNENGIEAFSFSQDGFFARKIKPDSGITDLPDKIIPHIKLSLSHFRNASIQKIIAKTSHVLNESNYPLLGRRRNNYFTDEIRNSAYIEKQLAVVFHGSDIRNPSLAKQLSQHSYFHQVPPEWERLREIESLSNKSRVEGLGLKTFVTTPDLLHHLPSADYLPLAIDYEYWAGPSTKLQNELPVILHRPSREIPPIKGTSFITPAIEKLAASGTAQLLNSSLIPRAEMRTLLSNADIFVDQIQTGSYGVSAIEALSNGTIVVGHVNEFTRNLMNYEIPIVEANPSTIFNVLNELAHMPIEEREQLAYEGKQFVKKWHSGQFSAQVISSWIYSAK